MAHPVRLSDHDINTRTHAAVAAYHAADKATAKRLCDDILAAMPTHPYALNLVAVMAMEAAHLEQALDVFDRLIDAHPDDAQGLSNRRICIERMCQPNNQWLRLGFHYYQTGRVRKAIDVYRQAIAKGAANDNIHGNLGAHLQDLGDWDEAERQYQLALALNPAHTGTLYNLGHLLSLQHKHSQAEAALRQAIALKPDYADAHLSLGHLLAQAGELDAAMRCFDVADALTPKSPLPPTAKLFNLAYDPSTTAREMYALAVRAASHMGAAAVDSRLRGNDIKSGHDAKNGDDAKSGNVTKSGDDTHREEEQSSADKKIKIGFVSGDFKDHPVGYFLENLLRHVNRERFEWHVFSNYESSDAVASRLRTLASRWTDIAGQSDVAARALITQAGIDILFDLSGHTALHRLPLFASRSPSSSVPVQITWLGWHDTTGLANMDYLLTDRASMPPARQANGSPYVTEQPLYLPRTRLCMMPPQNAPAISAQPMLRKGLEGCITFGSMQIVAKLSSISLQLWARILREVPSARLIIRTKQFREIAVMERFKIKCETHGLPMTRVDLLPPLGRGDYLASYEHIDILLDSYPYPGGTTTAEALWMGVPTITMGGNTMISRQGVSLLTAAGLQGWIATSQDDYVAKAVYWASHATELQTLRSGLREQVAKTALFDGVQFARDFEAAVSSVIPA
ncbi:MAG: tetratricopeptide repeat protein [Cytophagales bacterium]|nr:tetratricopeptide repeat protein [Cytophagales bacterium]